MPLNTNRREIDVYFHLDRLVKFHDAVSKANDTWYVLDKSKVKRRNYLSLFFFSNEFPNIVIQTRRKNQPSRKCQRETRMQSVNEGLFREETFLPRSPFPTRSLTGSAP